MELLLIENSLITRDNSGGKAEGLYRLREHGFLVPPFVVLSRSAHRKFLTKKEIDGTLLEACTRAWKSVSQNAQLFVLRSSLADEDSATVSLAGIGKSILGIQSFNDFLEGLIDLWSQQFLQPRAATGKDQSIGVILQAQELTSLGGVLFTQDPLTSDRSVLIIEASIEGPHRAVLGEIDEHLAVDRVTGEIRKRTLRGKPVITDTCLADLCSLAEELEAALGHGLDVEWAIRQDKFASKVVTLQCRPITTKAKH